jgi:hypothetical protein
MKVTKEEFEKLNTFFYHKIEQGTDLAFKIDAVRESYIVMAIDLIKDQEKSRSQELALTHLEESLYRAIQGLVVKTTPIVPLWITVED